MPVISIEAPLGLSEPTKQEMLRRIHAAVDAAYGIGDTITFLREYSRENVAINGVQPTSRQRTAEPNHQTANAPA